MQTENNSVVLGIHLTEDGVCAAYYDGEMPEAQLINNQIDYEHICEYASADKSKTQPDAWKEALQNILDDIFEGLHRDVSHITFSVPELTNEIIDGLLPVLNELDIHDAEFLLQDDNESYYDFVTFQNKDLWANEAVLFEERNGSLYAKSLVAAPFPHEKALMVKSVKFDDFSFGQEDEATDREFSQLVLSFFERRLVSSVFLEGEVFGNNWMKTTLKVLCKNRRVFGVSHTYVKGACYRAYRKSPEDLKVRYYMGSHKLPFSISMTVTENGRNEICRLVRTGTSWYDADFMWHFMVNETDALHFRTEPAIAGVPRFIDVDISGFPKRPENATKVEVSIHFSALDKWYIRVKDLGLGELYPSSDMTETEYVGEW